MAEGNRQNFDKDRKSEAQKNFDAADNAGRFAGDDADSKAAGDQAVENIRRDTSNSQGRNQDAQNNRDNGYNDEEARRDPAQSHTFREEAQNVADDNVGDIQALSDDDLSKARNKATEGLRQGRQDTTDSTNS